MRILVTGGTGFIGSHTVAALCAAGHRVRLLVRDPTKVDRVFGARGLTLSDRVVGDVTDEASVTRALSGCDGVVHAAALVALERKYARDVLRTNARGVELVVGGAHALGLRSILYVSSASALFTPGNGPITDRSPVANGKSAYARSKADAERFVRALQTQGAPIRSTYPPAVIGPDDPGLSEGNHTVRVFLRQMMLVTTGGFQVVDVRDLAALHARLMEPDAPPGRYLAAGPMQDWPTVIALMDELTGRWVRRAPIPGGPLRALGHVGDAVKRIWSFSFPLTAEAMDHATQWPGMETSGEIASLGVRFRDPRESYADTIRWLHRAGHLRRRQVGLLAAPGVC